MKIRKLAFASLGVAVALGTAVTAMAGEPAAQTLERGRYLVVIGGCNDCHTAGYPEQGGKVPEGEWLKGARVWEKVQSRATFGAFLPMIILLPILLVLYYTLRAGYEFYRQPLALWITDISTRDPFFLLPVLMGLAMMGQFRAMSDDPKKERSWILMPVAFTVIFAFFSAGLVLFWTVDTLAGWGQLLLIKRGRKPRDNNTG